MFLQQMLLLGTHWDLLKKKDDCIQHYHSYTPL